MPQMPKAGHDEPKPAGNASRADLVVELIRLVLALVGTGLIGYGGWLAWPPLGFLFPGLLLVGLAFVGEIRATRTKNQRAGR